MKAVLHIDGITTEDELETLRRKLEVLNTLAVHETRLDRVAVSYNPDKVNANMIETAVGEAGGDIISIDHD